MTAPKEAALRDVLHLFLASGSPAQRAFLAVLPPKISSALQRNALPLAVSAEDVTTSGGRTDLLLAGESSALALELKLNHRDNPFQYLRYRADLKKLFPDVFVVGISKTLRRSRGREALNGIVLDLVADHRLSWGYLVHRLSEKTNTIGAVRHLVDAVTQIAPELLLERDAARDVSVRRDVTTIDSDPSTLAALILDLGAEFNETLTVSATQEGASPVQITFGCATWATWFGDAHANRVVLMVDIPRPSKRALEVHFHLLVSIWNKTYAERRKPHDASRVARAARFFADRNFEVRRNAPGTWSREIGWSPPFASGAAGFFYANAFDERNFLLWKSDAIQRGWRGTVTQLRDNVARVSELLDQLAAS